MRNGKYSPVLTVKEIWKLLEEIPDPEIPVLSILDLGIVREVKLINSVPEISITPTYSGCPAMDMIERQIRDALLDEGFEEVHIRSQLSPAWTTDWISEEAKAKLAAYGIAPPEHSTKDKRVLMGLEERVVRCPHCRSIDTEMKSQFGSTACKALYVCNSCKEPFDYFKCI